MNPGTQNVYTEYQNLISKGRVISGQLKQMQFEKEISLKVGALKFIFPVKHKKCQNYNTYNHICGCLLQIQQSQQEVKCNNLSLMNQQDLVAAIDHYEIIQQVHKNTKDVTIFLGDVFHKMLRNFNKYLNHLTNQEYQELYKNIIKRSDAQNSFSNKIATDPKFQGYDIIEFYSACHWDFVKLNIPMRFKSCKHVECFDFTSILFRLHNELLEQKKRVEGQNNIKKTKFYCGIGKQGNYCDSWWIADLEYLKVELVVDLELRDLIIKADSVNYKFIYDKPKFMDLETYEEIQNKILFQSSVKQQQKIRILNTFDLNQNQQKNLIYENLQLIMNQKQSDAAKNQMQKYKNLQISLICPLTKDKLIEFPGRCINCNQDDSRCADLRNLISDFLQQKSYDQNLKYKCPICQKQSTKQLFNIQPSAALYFDEVLMGLIIQNRDINNCELKELRHSGEDQLLNEYKKQHKISFEQVKDTFPSGSVTYNSVTCVSSGRLLENPLKILICPEQSRVSFSEFFRKFKDSNYTFNPQAPILLCKCGFCNQNGIQKIDQLVFDEVLDQMLRQLPKNFVKKSEYIKYNFLNPHIEHIQNIGGLREIYPNKASSRGFLSEMNEQDYQEYTKQFDVQFIGEGKYQAQINKMVLKVGNFQLDYDQNGAEVKGAQEAINQANTISQSQQFQQYKIQIQGIKFRPNPEFLNVKGEAQIYQSQQFQ